MHNIDSWNFIRATMPVWSPLASGLVAAFIVHLLTQSRERERWLLDNKKQEFKELLTALSESYITTVSLNISDVAKWGEAEYRRYKDSTENLARVVRDRIFIVEDLRLDEFLQLWSDALGRYSGHADAVKFRNEYKSVSDLIIKAAARSVPKTGIQSLKFWQS